VPKSVLTRKRSLIARIAIFAMIFSLMAVALPASAHSVAIDATNSCPATTPSAGFTDIGGLDATTQTAINCLFAFGITTGTSATTYSPNDTVTRWQMALFLVRQAADHGIVIPAATNQGYTDIGGLDTATQNAINQVTQLGISKGTSSTTFSPTLGVSRWQMALFIYRLAVAAGVVFTNDSAHNEFGDIGGTLAEAQTAINALADAHIALGTGASAFSPDLLLVRWQMALFLTRTLAADNVIQTGTRVVVNPGPSATLALNTGQSRTYTATFTNADGTPYTQRIGIQLLDVSASNAPIYNNPADLARISTTSDGLALTDTNAPADGFNETATGVAGADGVVTFTVQSAGGAEKVIPVAWEDLDGDLTYESAGNVAPTEPFALGGLSDFVAAAPVEALAGSHTATVTKTIKASDTFEATTAAACNVVSLCSFFYDAGDIFTVDTLAATLADFEAVLSRGDAITVTYDPDAPDQSTFALTDVVAQLTVTTPSAATTVDAGTSDIKGTGDPDATIRVKSDLNNDNDAGDAGEGTVATGTVDADGNWTVTTPLTQDTVNNFVVTQQPVGGVQMGNTQPGDIAPDVAGGADDVFTITEGPVVGTSFTSTDSTTDAVVLITLDPGDVITIVFTGDVAGVGSGDTFSLLDSDGTTATIICGTHATCAEPAAGTVTITMTAVLPTSGGTTGGINNTATITALTGFTAVDASAISLSGDRTFTMP